MSRRDRSQLSNFFVEKPQPVTLHEVDEAFFGEIAAIDSLRKIADPIDIFAITPNPSQPRRAIPTYIRQHWDGQNETIPAVFDSWYRAVVQERYEALDDELAEDERARRSQFDLEAYLSGDEDRTDRDHEPGPLENSFLQIVGLAASIRRDGLTNPITVARSGTQYYLETGERRWLAYHLLYALFDGSNGVPNERERWEKIPAHVVDESSLWRMASENNVRENLNAISKARQFALLLMDLYSRQGHQFATYEEVIAAGQSDRAFYRQVSNGNEYPMPRRKSEILLNAMGFKSKSQLREHRGLLELPDEVWQLADDLDWTYGRIRTLIRKADTDEALVFLARREALKDGLSVGIPTLTDNPNIANGGEERPTLPENGPHKRGKTLLNREDKAGIKWLLTLRSGVGRSDPATRQLITDKINSARTWLNELESLLNEE